MGTLFRLSGGLDLFVTTVSASGTVGAPVLVLGTNLTGASKVTVKGTSASFDVVSGTEVKTSVPMGATSGPVQVTTPGSAVSGNLPFAFCRD